MNNDMTPPWTHRLETVLGGRGTRYIFSHGAAALSFRMALDLMGSSAQFRSLLTELLAASPYTAFCWETPAISTQREALGFEFVLVNAPELVVPPRPDIFSGYFVGAHQEAEALAVPNLGNTALMVVPRQRSAAANYTHLANFARCAPPAQVHALWMLVAATLAGRISSAPLWLSTAGRAVAWLHVRIDSSPKYYSHRAYADDAAPGLAQSLE